MRSDVLTECLGDAPDVLRMYAPADLHITVAFLGSVPYEVAARVWETHTFALAPVTVRLGPVQLFGRPGRATALGFNVIPAGHRRNNLVDRLRGQFGSDARKGADSLSPDLIAGLRFERDALLDLAECRPDSREPRPHVTIARLPRDATSLERRRAIGWAEKLVIDEPVVLNSVALFTWSAVRDASARFRIVDERQL